MIYWAATPDRREHETGGKEIMTPPNALSWIDRRLQQIAACVGTPAFIYSEAQLQANIRRVLDAATHAMVANGVDLYIPFFANSNPHVLASAKELGAGILIQSRNEYELLSQHGFERFLVSPGHITDEEIDFWVRTGHPLFLSSLDEVRHLLLSNRAASVNVRIDTLSSEKPGLKLDELNELAGMLKACGRELDCFELYCGSGHSVADMIDAAENVCRITSTHFPAVKALDFAGGFGFDYESSSESQKHFNWEQYFAQLAALAAKYGISRSVRFIFEPARDLLGDVGVLLLTVQRNLVQASGTMRLLTDGSRVLMPSAQYKNRRHRVVCLDAAMNEIPGATVQATLRGTSILRHDYILPGEYAVPASVRAGSYFLILDVGAYCATQHMEFLNVPPAAEVLLEKSGTARLISKHGDSADRWRNLCFKPLE
jgi:diaminopimelate decarboxylase